MFAEESMNPLGRSGLWLVFTQVQKSGERYGLEILNEVHWENASDLMITCSFSLTSMHLTVAITGLTWNSKQSYPGLVFISFIKF